MRSISAAEFGIRLAKVFNENRSSTAIFFIQQALTDTEDDLGLYWEEFESMLARLSKEDGNKTK